MLQLGASAGEGGGTHHLLLQPASSPVCLPPLPASCSKTQAGVRQFWVNSALKSNASQILDFTRYQILLPQIACQLVTPAMDLFRGQQLLKANGSKIAAEYALKAKQYILVYFAHAASGGFTQVLREFYEVSSIKSRENVM